jgi:hypothetical protein
MTRFPRKRRWINRRAVLSFALIGGAIYHTGRPIVILVPVKVQACLVIIFGVADSVQYHLKHYSTFVVLW